MMIVEFLKGLLVGLCASIPLGPIGVLCVQRTLNKGRASGFITGMGAATTDTLFATIALLSLSFVQKFIDDYRVWLMIAGGLIVALFGIKLFLSNPVRQIKRLKSGGQQYAQDYFSTILMTISNPGAFFLILGLMAFMGVNTGNEEPLKLISTTLLGVFAGATIWWYALSSGINAFRNKLRLRQLIMINRIAGIIIIVLGLISIFDGLYRLIVS